MKEIGIKYRRGHRLDVALSTNMPLALVFLPASDIAKYVDKGNVDIGITGMDIVEESSADVNILAHLGFGKCQLCVQAPVSSKIKDVKDLSGKRIVTSFTNLAEKYFRDLEGGELTTKVSHVSGSVEAACALGLADGIVDLVETGETMRAAGLEIISLIMDTQTVLIGNKHTTHQDLIDILQTRIKGVITAGLYSSMEYNIPADKLAEACKITPGMTSPTVAHLSDENWLAVKVMIKKPEVNDIMDRLENIGATNIMVLEIQNCRM
ncbi:ATP phosphoribosyltransferase [Sphaeroforma arctica JP610]|uniref:ATP phosphoribosyltransferase n=1 Tax=Sphaeroforma arctica JP610 TaxID=667725 RepID=A0A0L0G796_9EUKA|nr:ATP phosphoribosyltransferase [Sphaeroforma arctica JP610]KNC84917.1 ATP phosphoribosyltransferase [Sphaeroforma arctica JP610]|eukprot:XP_014158819.1 ATP phosphoribosyltransferase [Sphaeroforma arctica JP610]